MKFNDSAVKNTAGSLIFGMRPTKSLNINKFGNYEFLKFEE